jgi:hypothetical protein
MVTVFLSLALKPVAWVSWFVPQNQQLWFIDLDLKITAMLSWFGTQNQLDDDFLVAPQNRQEDEMAWGTHRGLAACFTWKQVGLGFPSLVSRLVEA